MSVVLLVAIFSVHLPNGFCPYRKPKIVTDVSESVDNSLDERFMQFDLVRSGGVALTAIHISGRNPRAPASTQRPAAQISEAS
jgi:hypothetical protein